jgi:YesN/AraC family two-component response regulator
MCDTHTPVGTLRVVVIDDNRDGADSLARLLRIYGHDARAAYTGTAGLQTVLDDPPDAVVCDLNLPGLHGLDVGGPVAGRSAPGGHYRGGRGRRGGRGPGGRVHHYLPKPVAPDDLSEVLDGHRAWQKRTGHD